MPFADRHSNGRIHHPDRPYPRSHVTALDALRAARRWWWILVLCPLLAAAAAYLVSDARPPIYRAQSVLVIEEQPSAGNSTYNDILASERRASTYSRLVQARPVLEDTISRLGLS